jgi:hypothetical protein
MSGKVSTIQDDTTPRLRIIASVTNESKKPVCVIFHGYNTPAHILPNYAAFAIMSFDYRGKTYYKYFGWRNPERGNYFDIYGAVLSPKETRTIELWSYVSLTKREGMANRLYGFYIPTGHFPQPGSKEIDENIIVEDLENWFDKIFPTIRIGTYYRLNYDRQSIKNRTTKELISEPIDIEKAVITSNLGDVLD